MTAATLPPWVDDFIAELHRSKWTGKLALNMRDGVVIEIEETRKQRAPK